MIVQHDSCGMKTRFSAFFGNYYAAKPAEKRDFTMKHKTPTFAFVLQRMTAVAATAFFVLPACPAAAQYTISDLGTDLNIHSLNNQGQVLATVHDAAAQKDALYLVTAGRRELLSASIFINPYNHTPSFNDVGEVAWQDELYSSVGLPYVDLSSDVYLYSHGVKKLLKAHAYLEDLNQKGSVLYRSGTHSYLYTRTNTLDLGSDYSVVRVNNKEEMLGFTENYDTLNVYFYKNGNWNFVFTGNSNESLGPLTDTEQFFFFSFYRPPLDYAQVGIQRRNISGAADYTQIFSTSGEAYISEFLANRRGDFAWSFRTATYGPSRQDIAEAHIAGKSKTLVPANSFPGTSPGPFCALYNLTNRRQCLYQKFASNIPSESLLYDANTGTTTDMGMVFSALGLGLPTVVQINDAGQMVVQSGYPVRTYLATPTGSVSGKVTFDGIAANAPAQSLTFEFRDATDFPLFTRTVSVGADGAYTVSGVAAGTYHVRVKGDKYLAQIMNVRSTGGAVTGANVMLSGGDADNNNVVDIADFGLLVNAYNGDASIAGSGYDVRADFDGDGVVDIGDFDILVNSYNQSGAP